MSERATDRPTYGPAEAQRDLEIARDCHYSATHHRLGLCGCRKRNVAVDFLAAYIRELEGKVKHRNEEISRCCKCNRYMVVIDTLCEGCEVTR